MLCRLMENVAILTGGGTEIETLNRANQSGVLNPLHKGEPLSFDGSQPRRR